MAIAALLDDTGRSAMPCRRRRRSVTSVVRPLRRRRIRHASRDTSPSPRARRRDNESRLAVFVGFGQLVSVAHGGSKRAFQDVAACRTPRTLMSQFGALMGPVDAGRVDPTVGVARNAVPVIRCGASADPACPVPDAAGSGRSPDVAKRCVEDPEKLVRVTVRMAARARKRAGAGGVRRC